MPFSRGEQTALLRATADTVEQGALGRCRRRSKKRYGAVGVKTRHRFDGYKKNRTRCDLT